MAKAQAKVVPMARTPVVLQLDQLEGWMAVEVISNEARRWMQTNKKLHTITALAKKACLHPQTVSNLVSKTTVQPRLTTVVLMLKALGFAVMRIE